MRRFLLYVHTGRRAALRAMLSVLEELRVRGVRAIVVEQQIEEILALPEDMAPPRLLTFLTNGAVDVLDSVSAEDLVELERRGRAVRAQLGVVLQHSTAAVGRGELDEPVADDRG